MTLTAYENSISDLCLRLDELAESVSEEFAQHQSRIHKLGLQGTPTDDPTEVRGAALASAYALLEAVEGLQSRLADVRQIIVRQQELLTSLHEQSRTDVLTDQLNRRAFDEEMLRRAAESRRTGSTVGLIMIDVDHFKTVNDSYGHSSGDKVLKGVANVLVNSLRDMDIVARYGGEEFAVILPNTNLINACRAAERARTAISNSAILVGEQELGVTISAGVAIIDGDHNHSIQRADDALYAAKQAGRNRVFAHKEGYCQPLHQDSVGEHGAQRRRWMRFLVEQYRLKLRREDGPWLVADVRDESLTGIGLILQDDPNVSVGEIVQINYCDDLRKAEVKFAGPEGDAFRLGLRWCESEH